MTRLSHAEGAASASVNQCEHSWLLSVVNELGWETVLGLDECCNNTKLKGVVFVDLCTCVCCKRTIKVVRMCPSLSSYRQHNSTVVWLPYDLPYNLPSRLREVRRFCRVLHAKHGA